MAIRIREFQTAQEAELFFRGGIRGGRQVSNQYGRVQNLHGLTLIINAVVVTLDETIGAAGFGAGLTMLEISTQITAAIPAVTSFWANGYLNLVELAPQLGVTVDAAGTANSIFGFSGSTDAIGTVIDGPSIVSFNSKPSKDGYVAVITEA